MARLVDGQSSPGRQVRKALSPFMVNAYHKIDSRKKEASVYLEESDFREPRRPFPHHDRRMTDVPSGLLLVESLAIYRGVITGGKTVKP